MSDGRCIGSWRLGDDEGSTANEQRTRWFGGRRRSPTAVATGGSRAAQIAGLASIGAGAIHAAAAGAHAEHASLSRLFVATAVAQIVVGLVLLVRGGRVAAAATILVNGGAVGAWLLTRSYGISWIEGLERAESPPSPTPCAPCRARVAVAGAIAVVTGRFGRHVESPSRRTRRRHRRRHRGGDDVRRHRTVHSHDDSRPRAERHGHAGRRGAADHVHSRRRRPRLDATTTSHADPTTRRGDGRRGMAAAMGPGRADRLLRRRRRHGRATGPRRDARRIDDRRAPAVRRRRDARRSRLPVDRRRRHGLRALHQPARSSATTTSSTPTGRNRSSTPSTATSGRWSSAMFIAKDLAIDDPELVDWGGPLMQWHVHDEPVLGLDEDGKPKVVGVTDDAGKCPPGSVNAGGENPMVHVWIAPHECGPFAALEGPRRRAGGDRPATAPTSAPTTTTTAAEDGRPQPPPTTRRSRSTCPASRASRPSSRRTPRTSSPSRSSACRSGPTPPWPRPPASTRSATPAPATSTTSSGTGSTTTCGSTRTHPESLVYEPQPDGTQEAGLGDVHAADSGGPRRTCPTSAGR